MNEVKLGRRIGIFLLALSVWVVFYYARYKFGAWVLAPGGPIQMRNWTLPRSNIQIFILTVLFYPLIEEITFRLPLKATPVNLLFCFLAIIWLYPLKIEIDNFFITLSSGFFIRVVLCLALTSLTVWIYYTGRLMIVASKLIETKRLYLFLISAFLFTLCHLHKIEFNNWLFAFAFLLIIYFAAAVFFGIVRLKIGFWAAVFFHILTNAVPYIYLLYYSYR